MILNTVVLKISLIFLGQNIKSMNIKYVKYQIIDFWYFDSILNPLFDQIDDPVGTFDHVRYEILCVVKSYMLKTLSQQEIHD